MRFALFVCVVATGDQAPNSTIALDSTSLRTHDASGTSREASNAIASKSFVQLSDKQQPLSKVESDMDYIEGRLDRLSKQAKAVEDEIKNDEAQVATIGSDADTTQDVVFKQVTTEYNTGARMLNQAVQTDYSLEQSGNAVGATLNDQMQKSEAREEELVGSEHETNMEYTNAVNTYYEMKTESRRLENGVNLLNTWADKAYTVVDAQRIAINQLEGWVGHLEGQMMQVRGVVGWLAEYLEIPEEVQAGWDFLKDDEDLEIRDGKPHFVKTDDPEMETMQEEEAGVLETPAENTAGA
jgi:chromosome segregation ATPase